MGFVVPLAGAGLILGINWLLIAMGVAKLWINRDNLILISIFSNLIPIRYYFVMVKMDKTGRGLLLVTFVLALTFFGLLTFLPGTL
ncbi:MAG: hypothetical protein Kow00127_09180 [Bacteroidales bacterium]